MARSTHGSHRALPWAVTQKPRPTPRVVRLGRAANDNGRLSTTVRTRVMVASLAVVLATLAIASWLL